MATLDNIGSLTDYMREYGQALASKVEEIHKPLFMPGTDWHPKLYKSLRAPFQGQGDAIMGMIETLKTQDAAMCIGEMGTGKTLIGALIPWVMMDHAKVLIMCPSHLTEKWCREIKKTVPGAEASVIRNLSDAIAVDAEAVTAKGPRYWVVSKETGKLSYRWHAAVKVRQKGESVLVYCPTCGKLQMDKDMVPIEVEAVTKRKHYCNAAKRHKVEDQWTDILDKDDKPIPCGAPLWQADKDGVRRYALADYLKKHLPSFFDFFVADEVHELKGSDTAQGNAFGALASAAKKTICLTGTLLGGYSSHLFYLNYRIAASAMKQDGFDYCKPSKFVDKYGIKEVVTRTSNNQEGDDNKNSKGKNYSRTVNEKPGISPELFAHQLIDKAVFLHLDDVSDALPPFIEDVIPVRMDPELEAAYENVQDEIGSAMRRLLVRGNRRLLGTFLINLLSYSDRPFDNESVSLDNKIYHPPELDRSVTYAKERKLRELVEQEISEGRKCLVYATFTQSRDVTHRLKDVLERSGIKVAILNNITPNKREAWFAEKVQEGIQVIITNPELVKTGLDLLDFPTIIYYQCGYNIFTLRQASRRSWRIGQTKEVRVFYLYYRGTMQERAVALVGKKLNASLAIEGKLTDEGLISMSDSEDSALALAKSLQEGGISGVEEVWKQLRKSSTAKGKSSGIPEMPGSETAESSEDIDSLDELSQPTSLRSEPLGNDKSNGESSQSVVAVPRKRKRNVLQRRRMERDPRRLDPAAVWGPDYKFTKTGWRKISQREKDAAIRREEERIANAWKYDEASEPGDGYRWQRSYSYQRNDKTVTVRGHWRRCKCQTIN